eukprot:CAMPEP_0183520754 /NCGR_PEP_ID=MMETSP0371-20130417/17166_1 /TAXON_ID=268820 /ORGANISM="Peridinium aciculiferum, Strain PAER-2" /LENGTH=90 /DNA_ID=CAMNT_0025719179 /DNA_START=138 /DNA_END=410 /DNA_ORIENTATION=-
MGPLQEPAMPDASDTAETSATSRWRCTAATAAIRRLRWWTRARRNWDPQKHNSVLGDAATLPTLCRVGLLEAAIRLVPALLVQSLQAFSE